MPLCGRLLYSRFTSKGQSGPILWGADRLLRNILSVLFLIALWLMMSGVYKPLVIGLGVAAAIVAVYTVRRMDKVDGHQLSLRINPLKFIAYLGWLLVEIAKTNVVVTRLILARDITLRQFRYGLPVGSEDGTGLVRTAHQQADLLPRRHQCATDV